MAKQDISERRPSRSGLILAGGEGSRLRAVTERLGGIGCPKQFCRLLGDKTWYEDTRERALRLFTPDRLISVVTRSHARFYPSPLSAGPKENVVIQPQSRGTATALLYALLRLKMLDANAEVAILPSDHFISDGARFMDFVAEGFESIRAFPDQVVHLGIKATAPETGYGWIEADTAGAGHGAAAPVRRFWEKPTYEIAVQLWRQGFLWNSFVVVARASWALGLIEKQCPELARGFSRLRLHIGSEREGSVAETTYAGLAETDFSKCVLMAPGTRLSVIPVHGVEWSDLGDPQRLALLMGLKGRKLEKTLSRERVAI